MEEQLEKTKKTPRRKSRPLIVIAGFVVLFGAIAAVTALTIHIAREPQPPRVAVVNMTKTSFEPATLSVKRGTKVIWTNTDSGLHQVASNPFPKDDGLPGLKSPILRQNQTYEYIANTAGSFGYHDDKKPTINGTLVVEN
jgi:plastocyanin